MELIYIWVGECYDNPVWNNKGYNLNGKYQVTYDTKKQVAQIEENGNYIEGFWGEHIVDVSMIVGENGAGKTQFMNMIMELIGDDTPWDEKAEEFFIIAKNTDGKLYYWASHRLSNIKVLYNGKEVVRERKQQRLQFDGIGYFNNSLSRKDCLLEKKERVYDASLGGLIRTYCLENVDKRGRKLLEDKKQKDKDFQDDRTDDSALDAYFNCELYKMLEFIILHGGKQLCDGITMPSKIVFRVKTHIEHCDIMKSKFKQFDESINLPVLYWANDMLRVFGNTFAVKLVIHILLNYIRENVLGSESMEDSLAALRELEYRMNRFRSDSRKEMIKEETVWNYARTFLVNFQILYGCMRNIQKL